MGCGSSSSIEEKTKKYTSKVEPRKNAKQFSYKGITILENVPKYMPETISREEIKEMVNEALKNGELNNNSRGKLTGDKIEAIIDLLMKAISSQPNQDLEDKRLDDINAIIGFYDINKENVKKLFFKNQKPKDEEVEEKLNTLDSIYEEARLFAIELEN